MFKNTRTHQSETPQQLLTRLVHVQGKRVLFFGEYHHNPQILRAQLAIITHLHSLSPPQTHKRSTTKSSVLKGIVFEHFNLRQQHLLDAFATHHLSLADLARHYARHSQEGFDILHHYGHLLTLARSLGIPCYAGFIPRDIAKRMVNDPQGALHQIREEGLDVDLGRTLEARPGTKMHLRIFHALIQGKDPDPNSMGDDDGGDEPSDKVKAMFHAQLLKDASLAWTIHRVLYDCTNNTVDQHTTPESGTGRDGVVLVMNGSGHSDWWLGAPERIPLPLSQNGDASNEVMASEDIGIITCRYQHSDSNGGSDSGSDRNRGEKMQRYWRADAVFEVEREGQTV